MKFECSNNVLHSPVTYIDEYDVASIVADGGTITIELKDGNYVEGITCITMIDDGDPND